MKPLIDGMATGLFLQLALGPVFFYILGITLDSSFINSLFSIIAVTMVDYIFIVLSLLGVSRLLEKDRLKKRFEFLSSLILMMFGIMILHKGFMHIDGPGQMGFASWTPLKSFISCFILTVSSPLTIVFWSSILSAKAVERNYMKKQLFVFGFGAGASTFLFLSAAMGILSVFRSGIPYKAVQLLNCTVGVVLISYGALRAAKNIRRFPHAGKFLSKR